MQFNPPPTQKQTLAYTGADDESGRGSAMSKLITSPSHCYGDQVSSKKNLLAESMLAGRFHSLDQGSGLHKSQDKNDSSSEPRADSTGIAKR